MPLRTPTASPADPEWQQACRRNQRTAARLYGALFSVAVVVQLVLITGLAGGLHQNWLLYAIPLFTACTAGFEFWQARWIWVDAPAPSDATPGLLWLSAAAETCLPLCAIVLLGLVLDWPTALGSPPVLAVLLILIICPLRLDFRLCLFQGALSAAGFTLLLGYTLGASQDVGSLAGASLALHFAQGLLFLIGGGLSAVVALQGRLRLREMVNSRIAEADTHHALTARTEDFNRAEATIGQKNELISILSHDLRAPLDGVAGLAELMARMPEQFNPVEIATYAGEIHHTARELRELLDNLVAWAELRTAAAPPPLRPLDLVMTVRPVMRLFEAALSAKQLKLDIAMNGAVRVWCDALGLATVIRNLLSNAVKFTPAGGRITLGTERSPNCRETALVVSDTGPGLPADFTAENPPTGSTPGRRQGLGLALCRQLLARMDGHLEMRSATGGTEARVWLRAASADAADGPAGKVSRIT